MRSKLMILIGLVAIMGSLVSGCGQSDSSQAGQNGGEGLGDMVQLIATEKVLPADFYDRAEQGVLATKVTEQTAFEKEWTYYGLEGTPPQPEWDDKAVIFLGVIESGTCPYEIESVQFNAEQNELTVQFKTDPEKACTDDATPRTFVLALDADQLEKMEWVVIENFAGLTPKVKLQTVQNKETILAEETLSGTEPPAAFIEVDGKRYKTVLGTYCWSGEHEAKCVDTVGPVQLLEGKEPIGVSRGETLHLIIEGKQQPTEMELSLVQDDELISIEENQFTAPQEKGIYYYSLGVWWQSQNHPVVTMGDAFYAFVLEVI